MLTKIKNLNNKKGFSLVEILVSVTIFSFILLVIVSFFFSMNSSNFKTRAERESQENARRIMETIIYETKGAKSIYTPTTTSQQLSLETTRYLPTGETSTFIDFFLCGTNLCLKKESQNPVILNSENVEMDSILFTQVSNNGFASIKINLTVNYKNLDSNPANNSSVTLASSVSLRVY